LHLNYKDQPVNAVYKKPTKHINSVCGRYARISNVQAGGAHINTVLSSIKSM